MHDQRAQAKLFTARAKGGGIGVRDARRSTLPHARTGGKDLKSVAAQLACGLQGIQVAAGDGGVHADAQAAVHPRGLLGLRFGFRAILVFWVELCV